MNSVFVLGSVNIDEVYKVPRIVRPGETITSSSREEIAGGKGANCCVACARAAANTIFYANIGDDAAWIKDLITSSGANTENMLQLEGKKTGRAIIQVESKGENSIFLFPGTNYLHNHNENLQKLKQQLAVGDYIVLQNEINSVTEFISLAKSNLAAVIVWNPAPVPSEIDQSFFVAMKSVDILIVNETELISLSNLSAASDSVEKELANLIIRLCEANDYNGLLAQISSLFDIRLIIVTKGKYGVSAFSSLFQTQEQSLTTIDVGIAPIEPSQVLDTTAAGDTWIGYFIAELAKSNIYNNFFAPENDSSKDISSAQNILEKAMKKACYASGISVTRRGAMPSIPNNSEVETFLSTNTLPLN
ncbi:hypothetical protein BB561_005213 [Smittium simulii]|uniref:Ribokinase n=1 Tax=Smittium simulii TaxID=133385 RepID=A0A2T9YBH2_9FUNG|nr:hypothetical protein BB561_005213 [Smittium simulii]